MKTRYSTWLLGGAVALTGAACGGESAGPTVPGGTAAAGTNQGVATAGTQTATDGTTGGTAGDSTSGGLGGGATTGNTGTAGDGTTGGVAGMSTPDGQGGGTPTTIETPGICEAGAEPSGSCADTASGIYALMTEFDVWWEAPGDYSNPGRGKVRLYLMGELDTVCSDGNGGGSGKGVIHSCGSIVPAMTSNATCDVYDVSIPDEAWDHPNMPSFETTGTSTGFEPGDMLNLAAQTGLIGISFDDINQPFPTADQATDISCPEGTGLDCYPDVDGDGNPGLATFINNSAEVASDFPSQCGLLMTDPYDFQAAPLDGGADQLTGVFPARRANIAHVGIRVRVGGGGVIDETCAGGTGDAIAEYMQVRIIDCTRVDGEKCTAEQATFLDSNFPAYQVLQAGESPKWAAGTLPAWAVADTSPSEGPRGAMVRLGDLGSGVTCDMVRNAQFPE